jgi:hypothetical protein
MRWSLRSFVGQAPGYRGTGLTQGNWIVQFGTPNGPVFTTRDVSLAFLVLGHEYVEGGLWASLQLAPFILFSLAIFRTFWLEHPRWPLFSYDDVLTLGQLGLRWLNQDLLPIKLGHVHVCGEQVFVELHLRTFCKF